MVRLVPEPVERVALAQVVPEIEVMMLVPIVVRLVVVLAVKVEAGLEFEIEVPLVVLAALVELDPLDQ